MALRSTASYFCRITEKRYTYVTKSAAQQQHSSSSVAAHTAEAAAANGWLKLYFASWPKETKKRG